MKVKVLLVEDSPADAGLTIGHLSENPAGVRFEVTHVANLKEAEHQLLEYPFDAILLDLGLADSGGLESLVQASDIAAGVPIVILSGLQDEMTAVQAVRRGAQDYLVKGLGDGSHLPRSILFALERNRTQQRIDHLAHYDGLTDIANRGLFHERLELTLARARRNQEYVALLFLDLDRFKQVNDTLGHAAGDLLLKGVAQRLRSCTRASDTVARLSGDEFALVVPGIARVEDVGALAQKILDALTAPFLLEGHELRVTASLGISFFPGDGLDAGTLLNNADVAMYGAKLKGRNRYQFYSPALNARATERLKLASGLRLAADQGELLLHYLPMVSLRSGRTMGVEALVRWKSAIWGLLGPSDFITLAEDTGVIEMVEDWVLREACLQVRSWRGSGSHRLRLSVNLSSRVLGRDGLRDTVGSAVKAGELEPGDLELDLTESGLMQSGERGRRALQKLRGIGVRIAIDDFGTAASLSQLKRFPVTTLKMDRSFVKDVARDSNDAVIHTALITMAHGLGLEICAEGVEREEQAVFLRDHHCDYAQGYHFSQPLPAAQMEARLRSEWSAATPGAVA
ncbi:MAG TPA: EAL domain-containing protein [Candidatus Polarisedimenticolia bacterium]|jgi:diguanylate cyclase (GGDEF)-like protein